MKKILLSIMCAIILGSVFGFIIYKRFYNKEELVSSMINKQVYAFQIGVFESIDNANKLKNKYDGVIVLDNSKYRVYVALTSSLDTLSILKNYYNDLGISYYIKQINVSDSILDLINSGDEMILLTDKDNYKAIIKNVLKEYEKSLT